MSQKHFSHPDERCCCEIKAYWVAFFIGILIFLFQLVGSYLSGSMALLADTFHVLVDSLGNLLAIWTAWIVLDKKYNEKNARAFGGFMSSFLLLATAIIIGKEGWERLLHPAQVRSGFLLLFAIPGAVGNAFAMSVILKRTEPSLTQSALMRHIGADLGQSLIVIVSGLILFFNPALNIIDPVLSLLFALFTVFLAVKTAMASLKLLNN